ncbi:MAG: alginate lyase family protein [Alphaproteobacteria bacterium]
MQKLMTLAAGGLALALFTTSALATQNLAAPFDVKSVRAKTGKKDNKPFTCEAVPAVMRDLQMHTFYKEGDKTHSIVDKEAHAAYKKASKPASQFEVGLAHMGNRYVKSNPPRPDVAACGLDWMAAWAEGGALLGEVNKNGEYTRKWLLGSIASGYMQIRDEPQLDPAKRQKVENWIREVATRVKSDYSRDTELKSRQNNHLYWAAWGVGAAGLALNDREFLDWGVSRARQGIAQINDKGALPLELARGRRAFLYHNFAAMPLFLFAHAAERNGIDLFSENNQGLKRLGELCLKNIGDPAFFAEATQEEQDTARAATSSDLGWVEIYRKHYADPKADAALKTFRPMKQSRFGGNITLLYGEMLVASPKKDKKEEKKG